MANKVSTEGKLINKGDGLRIEMGGKIADTIFTGVKIIKLRAYFVLKSTNCEDVMYLTAEDFRILQVMEKYVDNLG